MHRGRSARLDRLIRRAGDGDDAAAERYRVLRARAAIGAAVRWSLAQRGIDPARVSALRVADEAAAELAASGNPAASPPAEPPADNRELLADHMSRLDDRIGGLVARYLEKGRADPDYARASLAELFAWCITDPDRAGSA